jgi:ABC-type uncharacterized transport system substrate-binding protein
MRRRKFITLLGGAAAAWPVVARAQQAMPVIGFLSARSPGKSVQQVDAFQRGLNEVGYIEGQNVAIEYRWADGQYDRLPMLASELIGRVAVIFAGDTASSLAAKAATMTVPVVFVIGSDPVKFDLVASLARPGSNVTGVSFLINVLGTKRLGLLRELVPTSTTFGFLVDPINPNAEPETEEMRAAAELLRCKLVVVNASTASEVDAAFAIFVQQRVDGLVVAAQAFLSSRSEQLAALTLRHALPAIHAFRESVTAGGLMSYETSLADAYRQAGIYAGRILKGEKPADLPVMRPTKFELVINLKTAKSLGLTVPNSLLVQATEVIE